MFCSVVQSHVCTLSCVRLFVTLWTVACQSPLSIGFPRQEYWSGLPFPPSGDLPNTGTEPMSPMPPAFTDRLFISEPPGLTQELYVLCSVAQLCPTLCYPMDCSLSGSSVRGISQGRMLEWVAISSFRGSSLPRDRTCNPYIFCISKQVL